MKKYKLLPSILVSLLLFSCNGEIRVEYESSSTLENGSVKVVAHGNETEKNIVIDYFVYGISTIGSTYEVSIPDTMDFYSNLSKETHNWPVVGIGAGTGSVLYYPFYMQFVVPSLVKHNIDLTVNIGANLSSIVMDNKDSYMFFNGEPTSSTLVELTYKVFYNVSEDNNTYISDEDGYVYRKDAEGNKENKLLLDYGTREEAE